MQTTDIIKEINRLSRNQKIIVLEETIKLINKDEAKHSLEDAAEELYEDYLADKELTVFTSLDFQQFYETKRNPAD